LGRRGVVGFPGHCEREGQQLTSKKRIDTFSRGSVNRAASSAPRENGHCARLKDCRNTLNSRRNSVAQEKEAPRNKMKFRARSDGKPLTIRCSGLGKKREKRNRAAKTTAIVHSEQVRSGEGRLSMKKRGRKII